jgi:sugar-specific transcriptional regulator TrmB/DNA-binding CsgD family transcriptional regulator
MGDEELTAYRFLATTGGATMERLSRSLGWGAGQTERVLAKLRRMRLARSEAEGRSAWTAVHPETVKLQYAKPLSGVIDAWQAQLDEIREQLDSLSGLCAEDTEGAGLSPVVTVEGVSDIRDVLEDCAARCAEEVFAVQPVGRGAPALARDVVCRESGPMNSAVSVRVLLPHLSRYDTEVRDCVGQILESGGEVRTTATSLPALIVFDRSVAVLMDGEDTGEDTGRAHLVKHAALVEFIVHMVVSAWATSVVFQSTGGNNRIPESLTQETKTAIVQLLAAGYKDEVVARRLGIGVRTCRKYIAEMFGDLGAQSRFQAGWMVRDHMLASGLERAVGDHNAA